MADVKVLKGAQASLTDEQRLLLADLREIQERVLSGEVVGLAAIVVTADDSYEPTISGMLHIDATLGSLLRLQRMLMDVADEADEDA